jgi:hypothetical protein
MAVALLLAAAPARAQEIPEGIPVGPWVLAPSFRTAYEIDSNVFFQNESRSESDRVARYQGAIRAALPFRNSLVELDYAASKEVLDVNDVPRDLVQILEARVELQFRSGDQLVLRDLYRRDFARSEQVDAGGEQVFDGEPYNVNRWEVELSRDDPGRQGYEVRIRRQDFVYEGEENIQFFDYRGFHNSFEYRQPVPGDRSWVVRYSTRRFNHYLPRGAGGAVGVPFREETTDSFEFGLRGSLGEGQPYRIRLGYGRFRYDEREVRSEFDGLVGSAAWSLQLGGRTQLNLEAVRRTLPSNFESYYINNAIAAELEREWLRSEGGTELELRRNDYADTRRDDSFRVDVYWRWRVHERLRFEISTFHARRSSNEDFADYEATGLETAVALGWF